MDFAIGSGATVCGWSDRTACTVIKATEKTRTLQADTATLLNGMDSNAKDKLLFSPGGFFGHTEGKQRYDYKPNPNGSIYVARLTKKGWTVDGKKILEGRHHHYDYNF